MSVVRSEAADQKASAPHEAPALARTPLPSPVIPLPQVASRAMEVEALLRAYRTLQVATPAISMIEQQLPEASALIGLELERALSLLQERPPFETLEVKQELWVRRQFLTTTWLDALTRRVTQLQEAVTRLANLHQTWTVNQDAARAAQAPEPVLGHIAGVLTAIEAAQMPLEAQCAIALELESRVAREAARCQSALAQVAEAQKQAMEGLLEPGHRPIWNAQSWMGARTVDVRNVREIAAGWWREVVQELRDPASGVRTHVALFVALAALLWAARRWTHRSAAVEGASVATAVFDRPFSAALLISLVGHPFVYGPLGPEARQLFQVVLLVPVIRLTRPVLLVPVIRLTRPVLDPQLFPGLLMLAAVLTLETVRKATGTLAIEPAILLVEMLTGLLGLGYTLTLGPLRHRPARDAESERLRAARAIGTLARVLFAAGVAWTVLGYLPLGIRSELAAAVYDAGQAAGISFPFPEREVRLLHPSVRPGAGRVPERPT